MPTASGSRVRMVYGVETTQGTTFAGTTKILRTTSRRINPKKNILESDERRSDRQEKEVRHGFNSVDGALGFELGVGSYDDMFELLFASTWATVALTGGPNLATTSPSTFTRAAGNFITDGFRIGDLIQTTGFSNGANNSTFRVVTVTTTTLVVAETTLVTEGSAAARNIVVQGKRLDPGVVSPHKTATFERQFLDIGKYQVFNGCSVLSMPLSIQPERIVTGTWNLLGMSTNAMTGAPISGSPTPAPTNSPFSSFEGKLYEGGSVIAVVTGLDMLLENMRMLQPIVGSKFSPEVYEGRFRVSGTLTALFQSETLQNKFINETGTSLWLRLDDINGTDFHNIVIPSVKYTGGDIDPPADGPVPVAMPFRGLVDNTSGMCATWQRSN